MSDDYDAKRQKIIDKMAKDMAGMADDELAARIVSMLIGCEGNLNRYDDLLKMVLAAHRMAVIETTERRET